MKTPGRIAAAIRNLEPIWWILLACFVFFSVSSSHFFSVRNFVNILLQLSVTGIVAIGMALVIISGFLDLSVGSVMALSSFVTVVTVPFLGVAPAMLLGLVSGALAGALNGFFVVKGNINSVVTTLASMIGIRGVIFLVTGEHPIISYDLGLQVLGNSRLLGIPLPFFVFLGLAAVAAYLLRNTVHGRNTYAIGGSAEAARNAGIRVERHLMLNFTLCGITASIGGIISASRMGSAIPILGQDTAVAVITAVVLGGTRLSGGYGSIRGVVGGVLVLNIIQNGLNQLNVQVYYQILINGLILILVIYIDSVTDRFSVIRQSRTQGGGHSRKR